MMSSSSTNFYVQSIKEPRRFAIREKISSKQLRNQLISLKSLKHIKLSSIEKISRSRHFVSLMQLFCKMSLRINRLKQNRSIRAIRTDNSIKRNNSIRVKTGTIIRPRRRELKNSMKDAYAEIYILSKNVRTLSRSIESRDEKRINRLEITWESKSESDSWSIEWSVRSSIRTFWMNFLMKSKNREMRSS